MYEYTDKVKEVLLKNVLVDPRQDVFDKFWDFICAWSGPVAVWAIIMAVLWFGGCLIFR